MPLYISSVKFCLWTKSHPLSNTCSNGIFWPIVTVFCVILIMRETHKEAAALVKVLKAEGIPVYRQYQKQKVRDVLKLKLKVMKKIRKSQIKKVKDEAKKWKTAEERLFVTPTLTKNDSRDSRRQRNPFWKRKASLTKTSARCRILFMR